VRKLYGFDREPVASLEWFPVAHQTQILRQTIVLVDPETDCLEWAQNQLETPTTRVVTSTTAAEAYKM
jgi:hypothetical protein